MTTHGGSSGRGGSDDNPSARQSGTGFGEETYYPEPHRAVSRVSWGGIFVGAFITLALGLTLLSLGAALGLSTVDPATAQVSAIGWGTGLWSILTIIIATFVGAFASVRITYLKSNWEAAVQGASVWALSFMMMTVLAGAVAGIGAAFVAGAEPVAPAMAIGEAATWGYFVGAVLGLISGVLGGMAAYPVEMRQRQRAEPPRKAREGKLQPSEI